jgi:lipopolysaccharide/colanic/teichoic acid biosynthesis glycosyltransferase
VAEKRPVLSLLRRVARASTRALGVLSAGRVVELLGAVLVITLLIPVLVVISAAIKLDSPGPVFFRSRRVGHRGLVFRMLKFRKMYEGASGAPITEQDDARLTRVGRILARTRLDELPQILNVIRGEMSFVGPRPEDPVFVDLHRSDFSEILEVKPGITGLSQLAYAGEREILGETNPIGFYTERVLPQKITIDRLYARTKRPTLDLAILMWTPLVAFSHLNVAVNRGTGEITLRRRPSTPRPVAADTIAESYQQS